MEATINPEAKLFLEKLIEDKQYNDLSPALKESMLESLNKRLEAYILTAIFENMDEKTAAEIETLVDNGTNPTPEEMKKILVEKVPKAAEAIAAAMLEFRAIYLAE